MGFLFQTRLVNDPFSDPGLFIDFRFGRRAMLFDLGDLGPLSAREILRVGHVFVTHRHMDHFAGFDRLLRLGLYRPGVVGMVGPEGFIEGVRAKLAAYSWNLLDESSPDFTIAAAEFAGGRLGAPVLFRATEKFAGRQGEGADLPDGIVLREEFCQIEAVVLDHGTPCLAFAVQESLRVNVLREGLDALGLPVGPWLNEAKSAVRRGAPDDQLVPAPGAPGLALGVLKRHALRVAQGRRVAYAVDAAFTPDNAERIRALCAGADHLYIEAAFSDADFDLAARRRHLTAGQAGRIAREAGARRLTVLHHSPRYLGQAQRLREEAMRAFRGAD